MNPKVSIIVPIYNREDTLRECIDSLLSQTLLDIEVILIDDGSEDESPNICKEYSLTDNRIHCIFQKNAGVSSARNSGLKIATGEYIAFCDSDDWIDPEAYMISYKAAKKENCDLLVFGFFNEIYNSTEHITIENKFDKQYLYKGIQEIGQGIIALEKKSFFEAPWNKLFKRSIIVENKIVFDILKSSHEDFVFNYDFLKRAQSCMIIDKAFYHFVMRDKISLSKQPSKINPLDAVYENIEMKRAVFVDFKIYDKDYDIFLRQRLVSNFSGILPSIYRKGVSFYRKDRYEIIRRIMLELKDEKIDTRTFQGKVTNILFKTKSVVIIDLTNSMLAKMRYVAPNFYLNMRNFFNKSHIKKLDKQAKS